jgi:hypothetical protein
MPCGGGSAGGMMSPRVNGPQQRSKTIHRDFSISVKRVSCRSIGFSIRHPAGDDFASGYTDNAKVSCRKFINQLRIWIDDQLLVIGGISL